MSESRPPSDPELELLAKALRAVAADAPAEQDEALAAHERALARAFAGLETVGAQDSTLDAGLDESAAEAPATEAERAEMARGFDSAFLDALRAADRPAPLTGERHEQLLRPVLAARPPRRAAASWAAGSALAVAAAVLLALRLGATADPAPVGSLDPDTALSRPTEPLIASAAAASTSTRVDRIAQARSGDYRKNRFRALGVR